MALTYTEGIRARKKVFQNLKRQLRAVDSYQEMMERMIKRVLSRKRNVPEASDLKSLAQVEVKLIAALGKFDQILRQGFPA